MTFPIRSWQFALLLCAGVVAGLCSETALGEVLRSLSPQSRITAVQPMTGIVLWADSPQRQTDAIQLEFAYMKYDAIVTTAGVYNWNAVDDLLNGIAQRHHQAILRFYDTYPGQETTVPAYIKALPDYHETVGQSEGQRTVFPDWRHSELKSFILEFYTRFAERYDNDPRLAFLETGFGLWAEYHIYDGPSILGQTFPDKSFQATFLQHLNATFTTTLWMISIDAADDSMTPLAEQPALLGLAFGVFDDSFLCENHSQTNEPNWDFFDRTRWRRSPAGGEFSYYTAQDQSDALAPNGPHGVSFEQAARDFHITFMIGNDQPNYQPLSRIREAGQACGYRFRVTEFACAADASRVKIENFGVAPLYYDAWVAVNGVRATVSLKGLAPGEIRECLVAAGGPSPQLTIECDRLVPGQRIQYEANLTNAAVDWTIYQ
jgi:hypothetical protein